MSEELLSLSRAARKVGVTSHWLKCEAEANRVPHLRAGRRLLFDFSSLAECLRVRAANGEGGENAPA